MNKMNIPAPFRMALPTPPLPSAPAPPPPPLPSVTEKPHQGNLSSDESEMETSDEVIFWYVCLILLVVHLITLIHTVSCCIENVWLGLNIREKLVFPSVWFVKGVGKHLPHFPPNFLTFLFSSSYLSSLPYFHFPFFSNFSCEEPNKLKANWQLCCPPLEMLENHFSLKMFST